MPLTEIDKDLLRRCLAQDDDAWRDFVDRFVGIFYHVVRQTVQARHIHIDDDDVEDLVADIFSRLIADNYRVLRHFRGKASLASYLTVVARRVVVNYLVKRIAAQRRKAEREAAAAAAPAIIPPELRIDDAEQVKHLLAQLDGREAELVRSFYLENKSYRDISEDMGIPENSIGPLLARIRDRLRTDNNRGPLSTAG